MTIEDPSLNVHGYQLMSHQSEILYSMIFLQPLGNHLETHLGVTLQQCWSDVTVPGCKWALTQHSELAF